MAEMELSRRALAFGVVGAATFATMQQAVAQTAAMGGTWFDMVRQQHAMITDTFGRMLATRGEQVDERKRLQHRLAYQLTAHSVAEENVLYAAMALQGMAGASDKLYIEQAHLKVGNAGIDMTAPNDPTWRTQVVNLQAATLHHAKQEEEAELFPRLMQAAGPDMNARLTYKFQQQFASVQPS